MNPKTGWFINIGFIVLFFVAVFGGWTAGRSDTLSTYCQQVYDAEYVEYDSSHFCKLRNTDAGGYTDRYLPIEWMR